MNDWDFMTYFNYNDFSEVIDWQLKKMGTSLEEMKKIGIKSFPRQSGPLYLADGEDFQFNTNTGKVELYSVDFADHGFDPDSGIQTTSATTTKLLPPDLWPRTNAYFQPYIEQSEPLGFNERKQRLGKSESG